MRPSGGGSPGLQTIAWIGVILALVAGLGWFGRAVFEPRSQSQGQGPAVPAEEADPVVERVTFPEGLRREEMAKILNEKTGLSAQRYLELTAPSSRGRTLAKANGVRSLEGFLFPATYDIRESTTVADVVDAQIEAYDQNTADIDLSYARSRNLTHYDVLIIASMIEREVQDPSERALVAGVIYNRLKAGMTLGIDATVQYALGSWKPGLTVSDLNINSPYNTRRFAGLPPGPICSPGIASLSAAANPRGDYLYYVARFDGTGRHYFAKTQAEFDQAVARSRQNAANGG